MNIYIIIFIIIIPIVIFLLTLFNDAQFKQRVNEIKNEFNLNFKTDNSSSNSYNNSTNQVYSINNGIGFGFGKEYFTCESPGYSLTDGQKCNLKNTAIGIKFHKFKMRKNYNVAEIDDVVLNDYCSKRYLKEILLHY